MFVGFFKNPYLSGKYRRKFAFYGVEDVLLNGVNTMDKSDGESKEQALEIQPININTLPAGTFALHCRHTDQIQSTFKQIRANRKWPNKFRVVAHVVDYFPLDISKFAWRRCAACHKRCICSDSLISVFFI